MSEIKSEAAKLERTLDNLVRYAVGDNGELKRRRGSGSFTLLTREIAADFEHTFRRPMTIDDITPEVASLLLAAWKRGGMRARNRCVRHQWFVDRNATAAALGWSHPYEFPAEIESPRVISDQSKLEASYDSLHCYTLDKQGELITRRNGGSGGYWKVCREIEREFESVFKRPLELDDINPDVAMMMMMKWKRDGKRADTLRNRKAWFENRNRIAVKLGWAKQHDFSHIQVAKNTDWTKNRHWMAEPPAPEQKPKAEGRHSQTLTDLLERDYIPARLVGKSENTVRLYRNTIRNFRKWLGRDPIVGDLNTETVAGYLRWLIDNTELSPHTIEKERTELTAFWNFCGKRGYLPNFPDIPSINCPDRIPDAWTNEELVRLMNACEASYGMIGNVRASRFWPALVSLIYDCGERISAVMEIRRDDIRDDWLTVRGEYRKGKTRDARYKLRPITVERIAALNVPEGGKVFAWPYAYGYIWKRYTELLQAAGLPSGRRNKFHMIRRSSATHFEAAGGNATKLLGHTDRRTTEAYLDTRQIEDQHPADIVPGIGEAESKKPKGDGRAKPSRPVKADDEFQRFQEFQLWQEFQKQKGERDAG